MTARRFPVLRSGLAKDTPRPRTVPWSLLEAHAAQARANHDQTLDRLAERGGLDVVELWAIVHGVGFFDAPPVAECLAWLVAIEAP